MIDALHPVLLAIHITGGGLALLAGLAAILTRPKGARLHRRAGRAYVYAMVAVLATGVPLAVAQQSLFLVLVALFTGYVLFSGYRVLSRKRPSPGQAAPVDLAAHWTMVVAGVTMVAYGGLNMVFFSISLNPVLVLFGVLGLRMAREELQAIQDPPEDPRAWFYKHVGNMGGAYIATVTAFATINLGTIPELVRWLGPAAAGVPLIMWTTRRYRARFEAGSTPPTVAAEALEALGDTPAAVGTEEVAR